MITKNKSLVPSIFPDFPVDVITGSALDVFEDFFDNPLVCLGFKVFLADNIMDIDQEFFVAQKRS
jgi:hypothetical protein